jgi:hypothetical protein
MLQINLIIKVGTFNNTKEREREREKKKKKKKKQENDFIDNIPSPFI